MSAPFDGHCPCCGHAFTLADLRRMAVGDGFQRYILAVLQDGTKKPVRFDEFDPKTMREVDAAGQNQAGARAKAARA